MQAEIYTSLQMQDRLQKCKQQQNRELQVGIAALRNTIMCTSIVMYSEYVHNRIRIQPIEYFGTLKNSKAHSQSGYILLLLFANVFFALHHQAIQLIAFPIVNVITSNLHCPVALRNDSLKSIIHLGDIGLPQQCIPSSTSHSLRGQSSTQQHDEIGHASLSAV